MAKQLFECAIDVVNEPDLVKKTDLAMDTARKWLKRQMGKGRYDEQSLPEKPGRPEKPELLPPGQMPKRNLRSVEGRKAHIHALAHIELGAVDLTWDLVARGCGHNLPRSFLDNWVQVGLEEAKHFRLLATRLEELDTFYGAYPAHDGLWQSCAETAHDLLARLAIIPLVLEARGLDITPVMIERTEAVGDLATAKILHTIYNDEKRHVAFGAKWFRYQCDVEHKQPVPTFQALVRQHFRGALKPPFNDKARAAAGLTPSFYKPIASIIG
ncbi:ferritin-like domain-containing protein [Maritalea mediterranea]|uniref:Ferritin-like domain-containing protein n=1 Tax=Maritalea mediterranea TaxID=2909667 RepID=A0ABS9EAC2_9HYPH|nr:ferritin-like domain-containing protein [Maritalea mediterranea]MCF4099836.1 ferritin-like domain-containing protein [Maritalea mediterranea]